MVELRDEVENIIGTGESLSDTIDKLVAYILQYARNQYNEGYDEGDYHGYNRGHLEGKNEGYESGKEDGYQDGKFGTIARIESDPFLSFDEKRKLTIRLRG